MDIFVILADPTRRRMLDMLLARECAAGEFVEAFPGVSQPAVSQHLKVLRQAGLVEVRAEAQRRLYALRPERLREIHDWIDRYRRFWPAKLDALERHLERNPHIEPEANT
jgi:DNA-binding transcriptional ArsR family regulator